MRLVYWLVSFAVFSIGADGFSRQRFDFPKQKAADPCAIKANYWKTKFDDANKTVKKETCSKEVDEMNEDYKDHLNKNRQRISELESQLNETNHIFILKTNALEKMEERTNKYISQLEATIVLLNTTLEASESEKMGIQDQLRKKLEHVPKCEMERHEEMERILPEQELKEKCRQEVEYSKNLIAAEMKDQCNKRVEDTQTLYESKPIEKLCKNCPKTNYTQCKNELDNLRSNMDSMDRELNVKNIKIIDMNDEIRILKQELKDTIGNINITTKISEDMKNKEMEIQDLKNKIKNMSEILESKKEEVTNLEIVISDLKTVEQENTNLKKNVASSIALAEKMEVNIAKCASHNLNSNPKFDERIESMTTTISELKNDVTKKTNIVTDIQEKIESMTNIILRELKKEVMKNEEYDSITDLGTQLDQFISKSHHEIDKYHGMYLEEKTNRLKCENRGQLDELF